MSAEMAGALFTHGPAKGVDNVGFSTAIGTDNGRNPRIKLDDGFLHKGLESNHFEAF
jgi:hypothetical protein